MAVAKSWGLIWVVLISCTGTAFGQTDPTKFEPEERLKLFQASAAKLEIVVENEPKPLTLREKPLMRFTNDVGGVVDGAVMLWTSGQRPMVAAQVFVIRDGIWLHEFQSFADRPLKLQQEGKVLWSPKKAGGVWQDIPKVEAIETTRPGRLKQMKELAATFSVSEDFRAQAADAETTKYELRLLPAPLLRYEESDNGVDGAVFGFVHGTDPEALLTIELQTVGKVVAARYNFAALTCWGLQAKRGGEQVWSVPEMLNKSSPNEPYHIWSFKPDPSVLTK